MAISIDVGEKKKLSPQTYSQSASESSSTTKQESQTGGVLDTALLNQILSGLVGQMTDAEINAYAEQLLKPQLNAGLEAAQHNLESTRLGLEQEKDNLATQLARSILEQQNAYNKSMTDVETAALARGMGRSSYTLQTLANQGNALAEVVRQLTDENTRQTAQIQDRITQAEQQAAQTTGRLNTDYAANLAAKVQELKQNQRDAYNRDYMTAVSASMGSKTTQNSQTTGMDNSATVSGKITSKDSSSKSDKKASSTVGTNVVVKQDVLT